MSSRRDFRSLQERNRRALDRRLGRVERDLTRVYASVANEIRDELAKVYEKYAVGGKLTRAEMAKYNRLNNLEKQLNKIMGRGTNSARAKIRGLTASQYQEAFFRHAYAVEQNLGVGLSWGRLRENVIKEAVDNDLALIGQERLRRRGRERVRRTIAQGLARGASFPQMARDMSEVVKGSRSDAIRIARTEGHRAQVMGVQKGFERTKELGIEGREIWDGALDRSTRDSHGDLDGTPKNEEQGGWRIPGTNTWTPGPGQSGIPEEDINCRCAVRFEITDIPTKVRRVQGEGLKPYQSYSSWKKDKAA